MLLLLTVQSWHPPPIPNHRQLNAAVVAFVLQPIALVSDAGMPAISDPGGVIVAAAVAAGLQVVPVPGPCAAIAALAAGGLPTDSFYFAGFLPPKTGKRKEALQQVGRGGSAKHGCHKLGPGCHSMLSAFHLERLLLPSLDVGYIPT